MQGKPAALEDTSHPDWVPSQNMGHRSGTLRMAPTHLDRLERSRKRAKLGEVSTFQVASTSQV